MDDRRGGLEEISRATGLSRSTVSKALNNCGSVSSDTKLSVLEAAKALDYVPVQKKRVGRHDGRFIAAAVMPETPAYFWAEAARGMKKSAGEHPQLKLVSSLFSRLSEEDDFLYCLDYALDLRPDVLIVTPPVSANVQRRLSEATEQTSVVCFNETANFDFLFYVGADFYRDGVQLARAAAETLEKKPRILKISNLELPMVGRRDEGFRRELMNCAPHARWIGTIGTGDFSDSVMPARLAREIHDRYMDAFDAVYVSQGYLPQVVSALDKLRCDPDVAVLGYERAGRGGGERVAALLEQDTFEQGYQCMEAVWRYLSEGEIPEGRKLYIHSRIGRDS